MRFSFLAAASLSASLLTTPALAQPAPPLANPTDSFDLVAMNACAEAMTDQPAPQNRKLNVYRAGTAQGVSCSYEADEYNVWMRFSSEAPKYTLVVQRNSVGSFVDASVGDARVAGAGRAADMVFGMMALGGAPLSVSAPQAVEPATMAPALF